MSISTLFRFLVGHRQAIADVAGDRRSLWIGFLFVASAALAREYDGAYLSARPWLLAIPWVMSLVAASILFLLLYVTALRKLERPAFKDGYRRFLALFWMTAPLAWLYAIPYERFLSAYDALVANLWTLAIVALWRVLLITRVITVLSGIRFRSAILLVMAFADPVALATAFLSPKPVLALMGGLQHTPGDALILDVTFGVVMCGLLSLPVWLIGLWGAAFRWQPKWLETVPAPPRSSRSMWALAWGSVLVWALVLPVTQSEQRLEWLVDQHLAGGRIPQAVELMSSHSAGDFPPHLDPRPRLWPGQSEPDLWEITEVLTDGSPAPWDRAPWVREIYLSKCRLDVENVQRQTTTPERIVRMARVLSRISEGPEIAARGYDTFAKWRSFETLSGIRESLDTLLELASRDPTADRARDAPQNLNGFE